VGNPGGQNTLAPLRLPHCASSAHSSGSQNAQPFLDTIENGAVISYAVATVAGFAPVNPAFRISGRDGSR